MSVENLQIQKEETEREIKELHIISNNLEEMRDKLPSGVAKEKTIHFIKEIEKELEWEEVILQEIDTSINF